MARDGIREALQKPFRRREKAACDLSRRDVLGGFGAVGLLAAIGPVVLRSGEAAAQSNGGGFAPGPTAVQSGQRSDGRRGGRRRGGGLGSLGDPKQHGMNFNEVRERCRSDEGFRRRNSATCEHLLD